MKKKFRMRWLPLVLGALLSAYALAALLCAQDRWIYAICAPDVRKPAATDAQTGDAAAAETGLEALVQQRDAVAERLGDEARVVSCSGRTLEAEIHHEAAEYYDWFAHNYFTSWPRSVLRARRSLPCHPQCRSQDAQSGSAWARASPPRPSQAARDGRRDGSCPAQTPAHSRGTS